MASDINAVVLGYPHFESLLNQSIELSDGAVVNMHETDHDMGFREVESFDVWETPFVRFMAGRELGHPWTAIPVFPTRRFVQWMIDVPEDSDIHEAKDLDGRRIVQRYHGFTDAVWSKGVLEQDYGVDLASVAWFTLHEERMPGTRAPDGVVSLNTDDSDALLVNGVVDARLDQGYGQPTSPGVRRLWPDPEGEAAAWYKRTNVFPILHVVAVKNSVLAEHPSFARDLYQIFDQAKNEALVKWDYGATLPDDRRVMALQSGFPGSRWGGGDRSFLGQDPIPFGVELEANRESLERGIRYAFTQRAIQNSYSIEELFAPVDA
jgi:4,5-dihydroxyphthalate decarboxylase